MASREVGILPLPYDPSPSVQRASQHSFRAASARHGRLLCVCGRGPQRSRPAVAAGASRTRPTFLGLLSATSNKAETGQAARTEWRWGDPSVPRLLHKLSNLDKHQTLAITAVGANCVFDFTHPDGRYESWGGLVVGFSNFITGPFASVSGGTANKASGENSP